jgi:hypothetical protein
MWQFFKTYQVFQPLNYTYQVVRPGGLSAQTGNFKKQIPQRFAGASFGRPALLLHFAF